LLLGLFFSSNICHTLRHRARKPGPKKCFINLQLLSIYWQHVAATSSPLKTFRRPKDMKGVGGKTGGGKKQEAKTKGLWPKFVCQPWAENMTKTILACLYTFIFFRYCHSAVSSLFFVWTCVRNVNNLQ